MANLRELNVSLLDWEARIILDSLHKEKHRLQTLAQTSEDDDEAADAGNDLMEIAGLLERMEASAITVFGDQITNFHSQAV